LKRRNKIFSQKAVRKDTPFRVYWVEAETICREHAEGGDFVKRVVAAVLCGLVLTIGIVAQAVEPRAAGYSLSLTFDETTAVCEASCRGDKSTDYIKATLTLYQGSTYVTSWNGEGSYRAIVSGQRSVTRGKSYTLKLNYTINGVAQPEQSVTKVCR
jgi:hypothetical protein